MKPFILLVVVFLISAVISKITGGTWNPTFSGNLAMCLMLCFTALGHFKFARGMAMMIPAPIPFKEAIVLITGIAEIVLGVCLMFSSLREVAGMILIILFIVMLPANISAAIRHLDYEKGTFTGSGTNYLWFRVPLQMLFIAWVYFFSVR
jgi:uncharacterized membrane protein